MGESKGNGNQIENSHLKNIQTFIADSKSKLNIARERRFRWTTDVTGSSF